VCINNRKQHVERRERGTANSYRWWCFGCRHRQSCDIARSQGNCVALRLPLHNCGAMVPTPPASYNPYFDLPLVPTLNKRLNSTKGASVLKSFNKDD
jgi:hypothetical protein